MAAGSGILACYAYLRLNQCGSAWWLLLVAAGVATALTHYLGALILVILNLHWLLTLRTRPRAFHFRWVRSMVAAGVILAAWSAFAITRTRSGGTDTNIAPAFIFELAATLIAVGLSVNVDQYLLPTVIILAGFFIGLILYSRRSWRPALLIWLMALFPPSVIFLLSFPNRFYHPAPEERYLVIFAPLLYVGIGIALDQFLRLRRGIGVALALGLFGIYGWSYLINVDQRYYRDDYAMMLRTVQLLGKQDEPILFISGDRYPLVYYHLNRAAGGYSDRVATGIPLVEQPGSITHLIGNNARFWVVEIERNFSDPQNLVMPWLDAHDKRLRHIPIDYNGLSLYSIQDGPSPNSDQVLPPVIREARPGDVARIGVPGGMQVDLLYGAKVIASQPASSVWQLAQFPIYPAYPPGIYSIRAGTAHYDFQVTHSQPSPGDVASNIDKAAGPFHLLGYSASSTRLHPGESLDITLYWQITSAPPANYTVFVHLLGAFNPATNGPLWAGHDGYPAGTPTQALWAGQIIADHLVLQLPANTPPGTYSFEVGLYTLEDGKRLTFSDGADHVVVNGVEVVP